MNKGYFLKPALTGTVSFMVFTLLIIAGCQKDSMTPASVSETAGARGYTDLKGFQQVNLVSNTAGYGAGRLDPLLRNGWGISWAPSGVAWIAAQDGHVSTVYNGLTGNQQRGPVAIPSPGGPSGGNPTGTVFNGSATDFRLSNGNPARFLFVGVDGILSGWNTGDFALVIRNNSATAAYTGMTLANDAGSNFLYVANFRAGTIDVFDREFNQINTKPFVDPDLPAGYSPFNVEKVGNNLFVTYAMVGPDGRSAHRPAAGIVNVFSTGGILLNRFASHGHLNAPWGIAMAPASFFPPTEDNGEENANGPAVLIGNFGDGKIHAYTPDGKYMGLLKSGNKPIVIDGLWAISFAPLTATSIDPNRLFFAAGPNHEMDGLFGYIIKE